MAVIDKTNLVTIIDKPANISDGLKAQVINLIVEGGQITYANAKAGVKRSLKIGLIVQESEVIATCGLKLPLSSYTKKVFKEARMKEYLKYNLELGYITTKAEYEGNKLCQLLLQTFVPTLPSHNIFATTRKQAMEHILKKHGFEQTGVVYNIDLKLYIKKAVID
jgi:predicted GNAT family N-acyltransferase